MKMGTTHSSRPQKPLLVVILAGAMAGSQVLALAPVGRSTVPFQPPTSTEPPPTAYPCPTNTLPPLHVRPVTSPTGKLSQEIAFDMLPSQFVSVTLETGTFPVPQDSSYRVTVPLRPNTIHHLTAIAWVPPDPNCRGGGSRIIAQSDRYGKALVIEQRMGWAYLPRLDAPGRPTPRR
jgi:hypothetical protein